MRFGSAEPPDLKMFLESFARAGKGNFDASPTAPEAKEHFLDLLHNRVPPEVLLQSFHKAVQAPEDPNEKSLSFGAFSGSPFSGYAAFSEADITSIRENIKQEDSASLPYPPVVLFANNGLQALAWLAHARKNRAAVLIEKIGKKCPRHIFIHLKTGDDIPGLVMDAGEAMDKNIVLNPEEGVLVQEGNPPFVIRKGDKVTVDTNNGLLYKGFLPLVPHDAPEGHDELIKYIRRNADEIGCLSYQVNTAEESTMCGRFIGLIRMENCFLPGNGLDVFWRALQEPQNAGHQELMDHAQSCCESLLSGRHSMVSVRLMDINEDQLCETEQDNQKLRQALGLADTDDVDGFAPLANKRSDIHLAQLAGILKAAKSLPEAGKTLRLIVPNTTDARDLDLAKKLLDDAIAMTGYSGNVALAAMVESVEAVNKVPQLLEKLAEINPQGELPLYIGGGDLTESMLGIKRNDTRAIQNYMHESGNLNPFESFSKDFHQVLKEIAGTAKAFGENTGRKVSITFCGPQPSKNYRAGAYLISQKITPCIETGASTRSALELYAIQWSQLEKYMAERPAPVHAEKPAMPGGAIPLSTYTL